MKSTRIGLTALALVLAGTAFAQDAGPGPRAGGMPGFDAFDTDGDGRVTRDEITGPRAERAAALDADGDGRISLEELKAAHLRAAEARAEAAARRTIEMFDADGDGLLSAAELATRPAPTMMFDRMDADGDGVLTREEAEAARARMMERRADRAERGPRHHRFERGEHRRPMRRD